MSVTINHTKINPIIKYLIMGGKGGKKNMSEKEKVEEQSLDISDDIRKSFNESLKIGIYKELSQRGLISGEQLNLLIGGIK
jgi:hypothetical protein